MSCLEQNFGKIGVIEAFDLSNITTSFNRYMPKRLLSPEDLVANDGAALPLHPGSAKISETAVRGRGGDGYEVSLSWQVLRPSKAELELLDYMQSNPKCLRITVFGGAHAYILVDEDHYKFGYQRNGEYLDCSLKAYNINGIQQVI